MAGNNVNLIEEDIADNKKIVNSSIQTKSVKFIWTREPVGKLDCRLRHPKPCRYGNQCFRGKSCLYLHSTSYCDRCENFSRNLYFCEFCTKSFCQNCTVKQAHAKNIYGDENLESPKCENIHITELGCDLNSCTGTLTL